MYYIVTHVQLPSLSAVIQTYWGSCIATNDRFTPPHRYNITRKQWGYRGWYNSPLLWVNYCSLVRIYSGTPHKGRLSNEDIPARQVNTDYTFFPLKRGHSLMRTLNFLGLPVVSFLKRFHRTLFKWIESTEGNQGCLQHNNNYGQYTITKPTCIYMYMYMCVILNFIWSLIIAMA